MKNTRYLVNEKGNQFKVVVFLPETDLEKVSAAIFEAGGGVIGNYTHCSYRSEGTGSFRGNEKSNPAIGKKEKIEFVKGSIRKREDVEKVVKGSDWVVHFAAETHVDRSILDSSEFILTNVYGTQQVLEACRKFDCKLLHISTDEVYGHILKGSFKEEDKLNPRNPYAASKAAAELFCRAYHETYGLHVVITRSTNNYGPYQHPEKLIPKTIIYALQGKQIPVYGSGKNVRDWLFVEDNCEAIELVMRKGKAGEIYNIAGKQELQNIEVVKTILRLLGRPESLITFIKDRPGHDLRYSLDISKIEALGWKPRMNFEKGIKLTINWYKANVWWWKPLLKK